MSVAEFSDARDFLLAHRTDYATAYAGFRWPNPEKFNWALEWFDGVLAAGDLADTPALRITGAGAAEVTFSDMATRSNRVANGLRALGVARGDRVLLMLGNVVPLWEVMLAAMKLGAVVVPATHAADRGGSGRTRRAGGGQSSSCARWATRTSSAASRCRASPWAARPLAASTTRN